jgi:hydroxymethylpyrimidine/phosphomethylpyrimidine kinase
MPGPTLEFNHVMVYTRNLARSLDFYRDHLGFIEIETVPPYYARLRAPRGRQTIALHRLHPGQARPSRAEGVRLYFEVRDLDAFCRKLVRRGVRFEQAPRQMEWGWRHAYLNDPDGHELSLYWAGNRRFRPTETLEVSPARRRTRRRTVPRADAGKNAGKRAGRV